MNVPLGSIRIATWNLDKVQPGEGARATRIRTELATVDPDVIVLTESHPAFAPSADHALASVSDPAPDRLDGQRWVCIWVRSGWAFDAPKLSGEPERTAAARVTAASGRHLIVVGSVLPWRGDTRYSAARGAEAFVRSLTAQATDWEMLRRRHRGSAFCIAGDFNQEMTAARPVGTRLGREHLTEQLRRDGLRCLTAGDGDPLLRRGWRASIDHIVVDVDLAARASVCTAWPDKFPAPRKVSDHHGVWADIGTS